MLLTQIKHVKILGKKSQNLQTQFFSLQFYNFESIIILGSNRSWDKYIFKNL